jgi:undecaprenyl diphosphate synthase
MKKRDLSANNDDTGPSYKPRHVATNIDGSRRWAVQRGIPLERCYDHCFDQIQAVAEACIREQIPALTLHIVRHIERTIRGPRKWREAIDDFARLSRAYEPRWQQLGVRLHLLGDVEGMPAPSREDLLAVADATANNDALHLSMAINYSSHMDGIQAARRLAASCRAGELQPEEIDEAVYAEHLWSASLPPELRKVDMLVITGGVPELDDFMQREAALANVYFTDSLWPDFSTEEFTGLLERYAEQKGRPRSYETYIQRAS